MATWEREIFRGELARNVNNEYRKLLSVNKSSCEAEQLILKHFLKSTIQGSQQEGRIWLALALSEWQLGRLSLYVKEMAQKWATCTEMEISLEAIQSLLATLESPMPEKKKIRLPSHISHCPWPVGGLLAYHIVSSAHPNVTESPFYRKYVLLRIIMIKRQPITWLAPDDGWDESMLVGLYDWIGDTIPDPSIVDRLTFTAVSIKQKMLSPTAFQSLQTCAQSTRSEEILRHLISRTTTQRIETCCDLKWKCARGIRPDEVFTYLGCNPSFQNQVSPFFKTDITDYSLCHSIPFDSVLVNRFRQLSNRG